MSVNKGLIHFRKWSSNYNTPGYNVATEAKEAEETKNSGIYFISSNRNKYGDTGIDISNITLSKETSEETSGSYIFDNKGLANCLNTQILKKSLYFVQSNSAHHITYFLAAKILRESAADNKLVLNFDQHDDKGSVNSNVFFCGNWGGNKIKAAIGEEGDYEAIGVGPVRIDLVQAVKDLFIKNYTTPLETRKRPDHSNLDIYVTVDMDVLTKGDGDDTTKRTNWKHGAQDITNLINAIAMIPNRVIGADITGFPPLNSNCFLFSSISHYLKDIDKVAEALETKINNYGQCKKEYCVTLTDDEVARLASPPQKKTYCFQSRKFL